MENNYSLIMAGGVGSRFWPKSTPQIPKQFLDVLGIGKSLLRLTFERMQKISSDDKIYILTNENYFDLVLEQLPEINAEQVICEPERKNTAPCIAYASSKILSQNKNAVLVITPSDHLIIDTNRFKELIQISIEVAASDDKIVTLGILPTRPDTGFGYIEFDKNNSSKPGSVNEVIKFQEKPTADVAKAFVNSGNFYWNAGIFIWKAAVITDAIREFRPDLFDLFASDLSIYGSEKEKERIQHAFHACEDISIDFAILEHAKNISVVLADFDWSDLGTWSSLTDHLNKDSQNNAIVGANVFTFNTNNCLVHVPSDKLVVLDGLEDSIVVESNNMLLVIKKENEQELKKYLKEIEAVLPDLFNK
jgi:mannose-1-phosphate guanylyltransferase